MNIARRFIATASIARSLYSSKTNVAVKEYLEQHALHEWARTTHVDDQGAVHAEVTAPAHHGGTDPSEAFHCNVRVTDKDGNVIQTSDPRTGALTNTWHAYIAKDKKDLKAKAIAWKAKSQESGS